jgi:hypothetical protein
MWSLDQRERFQDPLIAHVRRLDSTTTQHPHAVAEFPAVDQSNSTQMSQVSSNGLPFNGTFALIPSPPPQPPPHAPHPPPQLTIPCSRLPTLSEDQFNALFVQFSNTTGLRLNARDFVIDGQPINPWALHRAVFARNGFDSVCPHLFWILSIYIRLGYCK